MVDSNGLQCRTYIKIILVARIQKKQQLIFWKDLARQTVRKIAWEENIYQVKAEYRAYEVLNGTYRRVSALPEAVLQAFITCDVETAKILNLIAILMDSRLFFEFFT